MNGGGALSIVEQLEAAEEDSRQRAALPLNELLRQTTRSANTAPTPSEKKKRLTIAAAEQQNDHLAIEAAEGGDSAVPTAPVPALLPPKRSVTAGNSGKDRLVPFDLDAVSPRTRRRLSRLPPASAAETVKLKEVEAMLQATSLDLVPPVQESSDDDHESMHDQKQPQAPISPKSPAAKTTATDRAVDVKSAAPEEATNTAVETEIQIDPATTEGADKEEEGKAGTKKKQQHGVDSGGLYSGLRASTAREDQRQRRQQQQVIAHDRGRTGDGATTLMKRERSRKEKHSHPAAAAAATSVVATKEPPTKPTKTTKTTKTTTTRKE